MTTDLITTNYEVLNEQWFNLLTEELKDLIVETEFASRWALVEGYHQVGTRILLENDNFERCKIYGEKIAQRIAESIGKSERTINYAIKFAQLYPDLNLLPEGKNISFHHIINKYLTNGEKSSKIVSKGELMKQLEEIKKLLETEWNLANQEWNCHTNDEFWSARKNFIRHLQDQIDKILDKS
jgi:hypothetical protein